MTKSRRNLTAQLLFVLAAAVALKLYYSSATVNELRWILAPTAFCVESITGTHFDFESHAGYMSSDHTFLIAASCAGVNFMIAAFLMLSLGRLWRSRTQIASWKYFPAAALITFLVTIVANTVRISSALWLNGMPQNLSGLSHGELHRLDGIVVYFGFLLLLFVVSDKQGRGRFRQYIFPLTVYYAITIGIPLLNGGFQQGTEFWKHSLFVLSAPVLIIFVVITVMKTLSADPQRKDISSSTSFLPGDLSIDEVGT